MTNTVWITLSRHLNGLGELPLPSMFRARELARRVHKCQLTLKIIFSRVESDDCYSLNSAFHLLSNRFQSTEISVVNKYSFNYVD